MFENTRESLRSKTAEVKKGADFLSKIAMEPDVFLHAVVLERGVSQFRGGKQDQKWHLPIRLDAAIETGDQIAERSIHLGYLLHHRLDEANRILGRPTEAVKHAGLALDLHPYPSEKGSDFLDYIHSYIDGIHLLSRLPRDNVQTEFHNAIGRLQKLAPVVPHSVHTLQQETGWCYERLEHPHEAAAYFAKALLSMPEGENRRLQVAESLLKNGERILSIAQKGLSGKKREESLELLYDLIASTARVSKRYSDLAQIGEFNQRAYDLYANALIVGRKRY